MDPAPQLPDRNLAMDLARATEAAALAAGRWFGRGDKNGADGAAVDAMRLVLNSVPMEGIVVIGEGEKDEAPMLFNGEEIGAGGPAVDIAVDPIDGTTLTSPGPEQRHLGDRGRRAGHDVRPGPVRLHGQDRGRRRGGRRRRPRRPHQGQPRGRRQGQGREDPRRHRRDPRPAPPRADHPGVPRGGRPDPAHHRRRHRRRDLRLHRPAPAPTSSSASAARRRASPPRARCSAPAARSSAGSGRATRTRSGPRSTPATTSTASSPPPTSCPVRRCSSPPPGISDGDLLKGVHYRGDGASTESLVMRGEVRDHPHDPLRAPLAEADAVLGGEVRLTAASDRSVLTEPAPVTTDAPDHFAYQPGLDGLRAIAVGVVVLYHLGYGWMRGGFLGRRRVLRPLRLPDHLVAARERAHTGTTHLGRFWSRRARRLLPGAVPR